MWNYKRHEYSMSMEWLACGYSKIPCTRGPLIPSHFVEWAFECFSFQKQNFVHLLYLSQKEKLQSYPRQGCCLLLFMISPISRRNILSLNEVARARLCLLNSILWLSKWASSQFFSVYKIDGRFGAILFKVKLSPLSKLGSLCCLILHFEVGCLGCAQDEMHVGTLFLIILNQFGSLMGIWWICASGVLLHIS